MLIKNVPHTLKEIRRICLNYTMFMTGWKKPKNKNAAGSSRIIKVSHSGILLLTKKAKLIPRAQGITSHSFLE